jgi:prepilin-type N-terminal cleavage/methylation domain-containing protein
MGLKSQGNRGQLLWGSGTLLAEDRGVDFRLPSGERVRARRGTAGFTLLELLIVIIMIGVIVTLAIPSISAQMRDRRTNQAAHQVSLIYRQARAIAMGRGSAVLVHFDSGIKPRGRIELREAIDVNVEHCQTLPATSCSAANWNAAAVTANRLVTAFDLSDLDAFSNVQMKVHLANGNDAGSAVDICFSPLGRPFRRLSFVDNFAPMTDVPYIEVSPVDGVGLTRTVLVVPNGVSRLAL